MAKFVYLNLWAKSNGYFGYYNVECVLNRGHGWFPALMRGNLFPGTPPTPSWPYLTDDVQLASCYSNLNALCYSVLTETPESLNHLTGDYLLK